MHALGGEGWPLRKEYVAQHGALEAFLGARTQPFELTKPPLLTYTNEIAL